MIASLVRIWAIALNAFREAKRNSILIGVLVLVLGIGFLSTLIGALSMTEQARVVRDYGVAGISLGGALTAIYVGVSLLYSEVQKRTIYAIVAKPIARWEFVVGKYLGMVLVLSVLVGLSTAMMALLLRTQDVAVTDPLVKAIVLAWLEVLVVAAVAVFFSSFSSPFLSGIFTLALWVIGRVTPDLRMSVETAESTWIKLVAKGALAIVPDLHLFSVSGRTVDGNPVSINADFVGWDYVATAALHGGLWIAALLILACVIFRSRDFV